MAANLMGGPKFKMPRVPCGDEVERIVEKGKARANTGASAGPSSSTRPVPEPVPILAVDGVADGGVYLSKSTDGRGGSIEEEGLKREARLNALKRLDPEVAKRLREMSSKVSSSSSGESSGRDSSSSESDSKDRKRRRKRDRKGSKKKRRKRDSSSTSSSSYSSSSSSSSDGKARARKKLEKRSREELAYELTRLRRKNGERRRELERGGRSRKSSKR